MVSLEVKSRETHRSVVMQLTEKTAIQNSIIALCITQAHMEDSLTE